MVLKKLGVEIETTVLMQKDGTYSYREHDVAEIASDFSFSVHTDNSIHASARHTSGFEFVSLPREKLSFLRADIVELYSCLDLFPNDSCGMHVHVSFDNPEDLLLLSSWEFVNAWQRDCQDPSKCPVSHLFRTKKAACHAKEYFKPYANEQDLINALVSSLADKNSESRYRSVNFHAWVKKGRRTIEFRSWASPMSALEANEVVDFTSDYIKKYLKEHCVGDLVPQLVVCCEEDDLSGESVIVVGKDRDDKELMACLSNDVVQANNAVLYDGWQGPDW